MIRNSHLKQIFAIFILTFSLAFLTFGSAPAQTEEASSSAAESFNLGVKAMQNGDTTDAVTYYRAAIVGDDAMVDAYFNLGSIYFAQGNYTDAGKNFKKVTELDAQSAEGFANYGKVLFAQEKYDDAMTAYEGALSADPNHAEAEKELGKLHYKKAGKQNPEAYNKAIDHLGKYLKHDSTDSYAYYLMAMAYKKKKDNKKSIANFQNALKYDPNHFESVNSLAGIYLLQQSYSQAINYYEKALKIKPKNYRTARNLAIAVQSQDPENYGAAIGAWEKFLSVAGNNSAAKKYVDQAQQLVKDLKEAKTISEE